MKNLKVLFLAVAIFAGYSLSAQMAVTTDGTSADASAMLEVKSTTKGMLMPRMALAEIEAIESPANGLIVYNTDDSRFYFYDGTAAEWKEIAIGAGTITPGGTPPAVGEVTNTTTGDTWMDRNLGATQMATASNDADSYGDLYQWGRATEGHEKRDSDDYTVGIASTAVPNLGNPWDGKNVSITNAISTDWIAPDNTLWQGTSGTNNPCPNGYRLPTTTEVTNEKDSWSSDDRDGAFASVLKLPWAGKRIDSGFDGVAVNGYYWTSTVASIYSNYLLFYSAGTSTGSSIRRVGCSVRCIKD